MKKVLLAIIVVVLVALSGYFTWAKKTVTSPVSSDWKTYVSSEYGFEIQVPSDWEIKAGKYEGGGSVSLNSQENLKIFEQAKEEKWMEGPASNVNVIYYEDLAAQAKKYENITLTAKTLEEYIPLSGNFWESKKIVLDGQEAFRGREGGLYDMDAIWIQRDNHFYKIWLTSKVGMDTQLSEKIISTFKFTK